MASNGSTSRSGLWFALQTRRKTLAAFVMALLVGAMFLLLGLAVEPVPDISPRLVLVSATLPGLATEEVEKQISFPLESAMVGLPGIVDLRSVSRTGVSVVYIQFSDDTDIILDRQYVSQRLQTARDMIELPGLSLRMGPFATGMGEIMQLELTGGRYDGMALNRLMTWTVAPQLKLVPGVADINVNGGAEETFQIALEPSRLSAFGVSVQDVERAIDTNNASAGGGWITRQAEQEIVVGRARVTDLEAFGAIPVRLGGDGRTIRLTDIGTVSRGPRTRLGAVTRNGLGETVLGVVMMQQGESSDAVLQRIDAALPAIRKSLPPGVKLLPIYRRSELTDLTIDTVKENLLIGAVLVLLVLGVVIGNWRAALVIASVIPVSLLAAMAGMRVFGISANLLSLGAIDFGMIVDASLVIVEHFLAHRDVSRDAQENAVLTLRTIMRPVCFAVTVIIMVYLPILTLQGVEGKMFRPMAQTIIMALVVSLIYALICVPVLAGWALRRPEPDHETRFVRFLRARYEPALRWSEGHSGVLIAAVLVVFAFAVLCASRLGGEFVPTLEEGALIVTSIRLPSASLPTVLHSVTEQEKLLLGFPEVRSVVSNTGTSAIPTDPMGPEETDTFIYLRPRSQWKTAHTQSELVTKMDATLMATLPDAQYEWSQPIQMRMDDMLSGVRTTLALSIYGDDLDTLWRLAHRAADTVRHIPGAADVSAAGNGTVPFLQVDVDRDRAARLGVAVPDILSVIEAVGGHAGRPVVVDNALVPTQVRFAAASVSDEKKIGRLRVRRADGRAEVLLSEVTHFRVVDQPPRIDRDGIRRRVIVQANVRGRDTQSFVDEARRAVAKEVVLPSGYRIVWAGQFRNLQSAMHRLQIVVPIALALIFGLLVVALGSFGLSAMVFVNLPVAATGGIFALSLRGLPFSIAAGVGFIALFGVAILNSVVLVSQILVLRREGQSAMDAAFGAARSRFRAVMATALVASLGFFPMAFSGSAGAEVERPLATVVIGGLISSTILTLLVLPTLYARLFGRRVG
ncbi:efflux RND transporter permease subunit [Brytella acorum]|uniref:CusA/CzcA family heavy metal efflux RND transporter n=1 Tax=Brytella acorum TaxID=2959299 RepID=A0AA35VEH5_9PROT|nr:CusA/CzcA family heavy metal efflux RND transporter [Brytella acorum]MDF3624316.1 CusA/CzcA family heavy metal efflux RND transporter [Brytella acorum]CAI9121721.1 CusA/CzcA family heavy metal efflux RND transporter [Brytella acorum]